MPKQQALKSDRHASVLTKIIGLLPPSIPAKIYRTASLVPILKTILNKIILSKIPPQINIQEGTIILDQTDVAVSGTLALGSFEDTEIELFRKSLKNGFTVVDIGANIGYYTIIASGHIGSNGKIFAYEPENRNYSFLQKNIEVNRLTNVKAQKIGLSDKKGSNTLYLDPNNKGHHSLVYDKDKPGLTIELDTLDNSLKQFGSPKIDIIKIDIEGAEFLALEGMRETIQKSPNLIIFTEVYPKAMARLGGNAQRYLENLAGLGFSLSLIDENKKDIQPITNIEEFIQTFPKGESFKNIFAVKK
ncbi:MAG: FkbM family methyltransferase [Candidatus Paceibacterota bacterium]|jgi:FkbM family methyltransferase